MKKIKDVIFQNFLAGVNNGAQPSSLPGRPTQTTLKPNNTGVGGGARVGLFKDMGMSACVSESLRHCD